MATSLRFISQTANQTVDVIDERGGIQERLEPQATSLAAKLIWLEFSESAPDKRTWSVTDLTRLDPGTTADQISRARSGLFKPLGRRLGQGCYDLVGVPSDLMAILSCVTLDENQNPTVDNAARLRRELKDRSSLAHTWFLDRVGRNGMIRDERWAKSLVALIDWIWTNYHPGGGSPGSADPELEPEGNSEDEQRFAFEYEIRIADLAEPVRIALVEPTLDLTPNDFRTLTTTIDYMTHISSPPELFYVGVVFSDDELPRWFQRDAFFLREVVNLPEKWQSAMSARYRRIPDALKPSLRSLPPRGTADDPRLASWHGAWPGVVDAAAELVGVTVQVEGQALDAELLHLDGEGICWGYALTDQQRRGMQQRAHVRVTMETFISSQRSDFPFAVVVPTLAPSVHFDVSRAAIGHKPTVRTAFATSKRQRAFSERVEYADGRVSVRAQSDVWVLPGSGCTFRFEQRG